MWFFDRGVIAKALAWQPSAATWGAHTRVFGSKPATHVASRHPSTEASLGRPRGEGARPSASLRLVFNATNSMRSHGIGGAGIA